MARVRKERVSVEKLVLTVMRHWNAGGTLTGAARELKVTAPAVSSRLARLRKMGVKGLPEWGMTRKKKARSVVARARWALRHYATAASR